MIKIQIGLAVTLLFFLGFARAEIEASKYTQTRIVEIHSLDYSDTTAIMSGYRYSFSGLNGWDLPPIKMYGANYGSYQMLRVAMKVKVEYRLSTHSRVVVQLEEVPYNTKLGVPG